MKQGIIVPTAYLNEFAILSDYHLVLAHMVDQDPVYRDFYYQRSVAGDIITLDNSSFELGDDVFSPEDLVKFAEMVGATEVMAPERFPDAYKTADVIREFCEMMSGLDKRRPVFATIHGRKLSEALMCGEAVLAANYPLVQTIGLSCRLDFEHIVHPFKEYQQALSRYELYVELCEHVLHKYPDVKVHLLGLNHPIELTLYHGDDRVRSNDTSAAWTNAYLDKIVNTIDYEKPSYQIDFGFSDDISDRMHNLVMDNIEMLSILGNLGCNQPYDRN
jgi:hypothetical protein